MKKLLLVLSVYLLTILPVYANTVDINKKGSILLELNEHENNEKIANANIELIKIADAKIDVNGNIYYQYISALENCNVNIQNVMEVNIDEIFLCLNENTPKQSSITNNEGKLLFKDLDLGLYLIQQVNDLESYTSFDHYLVTLPSIEDNIWVYDLYSIPKTEIRKKTNITIIIEWNTEKDINDKEVHVDLFNDNNKINEYLITKDDNWTKYDSVLLSDNYSVKGENIDGFNISYVVKKNIFKIIYSDNLPQTGENIYIIYILAFSGLVLIVLGVTLNINEKNR